MADFILPRSLTSDSKFVASCIMTESRKPPTSPALTMLIMIGGNTRGCFASAADSAVPVSTSLRTSLRTRASSLLSVCSERIVSVRSNERPELTIVANWRAMTDRSLSFTLLPNPGIVSSFFIPEFAWVMLTGA